MTKAHVEAFQAWMVETRSASTALNKHKSLQQFFKWLLEEDEITRSPMVRVKQPKTPQKLIPVIRDDDTKRLLESCRGKGFVGLRNEAVIRMLYNTGARLSEVGNLLITDVDLNTESVRNISSMHPTRCSARFQTAPKDDSRSRRPNVVVQARTVRSLTGRAGHPGCSGSRFTSAWTSP